MKAFTKVLAIVMVLALATVVFAACGGGDDKTKGDDTSSAASAVESGAESKAESKADADYDNPTKVITDYADMEAYAKEMQSNGHQGEVVKVTGVNSRSNFGAKASVMIADGNGGKIGTTYMIDGATSIEDYPEEDANIEVTGVVTLSEGGIGCYIAAPKEYVKTL